MIQTVLQLVVVAALVVATAAEEFGVCYDSYDAGNMPAHFRTIRQRFGSVRTFQTAMGSQNAITAAANAGLKIAAGVWILGNRYQVDLDAAIAGAKANPNAVQVIFIGNEELHQGWSASRLASVVQDAKSKIAAAGVRVPIGIVQTDGDLLANPWLADQVDVVGANIHPFFSGAPDSKTDPIQDFKRRWQAIVAKFGAKARVTEVGWPTQGGSFQGHHADAAMAEKFYNDMKGWHQSTGVGTYHFMFHDNLSKGGFESYFGLAHPSGQWKFGGGPVNPPTGAPVTQPPATTAPPAPTTNPPRPPSTTAPPAPTTTYTPPTTATPATTAAPTSAAPTTAPPTTSAPTTAAPTTAAPTTAAPTTTAPITTAPPPTTNAPSTTAIAEPRHDEGLDFGRDANHTSPNSTNSSDIAFPTKPANATDLTNSTESISFNSTSDGAVRGDSSSSPRQDDLVAGNRAPTDAQGSKDANVQGASSNSGPDVGVISGAAVGAAAAAALAVLAVVRYRRAQAIRDENDRKSDERSELAMLSRRSAIMML